MENDAFFKDYHSFVSFRPDRCGKATLFENEHLLVGLNCLEPRQEMEKHAHHNQNRFYLVLEGTALCQVGEQVSNAVQGTVIWVPENQPHKIINDGIEKLVLLIGFTPPHEN